jgi:hypothetical protein
LGYLYAEWVIITRPYVYFRLGRILAQLNKPAETGAALLEAVHLSKENELVETLAATEKDLSEIR